MRLWSCLSALTLLLGCASAPPSLPPKPVAPTLPIPGDGAPPTAQHDVVDTYHGVEVHDVYRWLEGDGPDAAAFVDAQNVHARAFLDALPEREAIAGRLREIVAATTVAYGGVEVVGGQVFAMRFDPSKQQRVLVVMPSPDAPDQARTLIDPNVLDPTGKAAIDFYRVSPDGKLVAASISEGGSERGDVHVYEVATGKAVFEVVPGVNGGTAGGDLAWLADNSGFYYSRYPRGTERAPEDMMFYVQLYRHQLGTPTEQDVYEVGQDFPRIAEVFPLVADNGDALCAVQKGDGGEFAFYLKRRADKDWSRILDFEDRVVQAFFGPKDDLYLISLADAPRGRLLRAPRAGFSLAAAKVLVPEAEDALEFDIQSRHALTLQDGRIYLTYQLGGPSEVRVFDLAGKRLEGPALPPVSSVGGAIPVGKSDVLFGLISFVTPGAYYRFAPKARTTTQTRLSSAAAVDLSAVTVTRELATSKDGTKVPVNILLPKGAKKGQPIPFLVTGYGGYGISIGPTFQAMRSVLLDRGVGLAVLNLRGGGEFGEAWHHAGMLTRKQNVFDDSIAGVEYLVEAGYADKGRIGITGGSNGGLLMGAVLTQRPELFRVVTSFVGIYDMLRVELGANGEFNTTEFGSVKDPEQFAALHAYSPYHRVSDGVAYPPTLFMVGANDVRVLPLHSRKMWRASRPRARAPRPTSS